MEKNERVLRKRYSHNQLRGGNITPRRGRRSSHHIRSNILQDESLPSMRSLHIDKSMVHHLDSVAATTADMQPRHMLSDNTNVSNITLTPGWTHYLDQTYNLHSAKQSSQKSVLDDSSVPEESGNFEDMLKSPGKRRHFQHRRRNLILKDAGTELFTAAFTRSTPQRSVISTPQPKGVDEISVEDLEEATPIVSQPFKRRRNVKTNPHVFIDAFEDVAIYSPNSVDVVSNRHEKSSSMKNASASPQRSLRDRSGNRHGQELEQQSDVQSDSTSPNRRQPQSTHELVGHSGQTKNVISGSTSQSSVIFSSQAKGGDEISFEDPEEASPVVSQPFKRRRNVKTNPSVFEEYKTSPQTPEENVSNRLEKSSGMKNASASPQRSLHDRSGIRHVQELEEQSDVQSDSTSPSRRQPQSTHDLVGHSGQTKNVISSLKTQSSVILPPEAKGGDEISFEDPEEASPVVSQPFKRRRNVKTNPSVFEAVFEEYQTSPQTPEKSVSNRLEKSSGMKNASASPQKFLRYRSGNRHGQELEEQSDVQSDSTSPNRRQPQSTQDLVGRSGQTKKVISGSTSQSSVIFSSQAKGGDEISFEDPEEASPVVSQPFKRRRNVKTNPSVFEAVFEEYKTSPQTPEENVTNRLEKSSGMKNASASPQRSLCDRSGNRHVQELEEQSDVQSDSTSPNRRQPQSTHDLVGHSGQTKNVISSSTSQSSVILPSQAKGGDEISFEGPEEAGPVVSQPFKRRRNVKTNPSVFEAVFEEYKTSAQTTEENVSNRLEKSSGMKNASASPQRSLRYRSGNRHGQELEEQSDVQSDSTSPKRRQPQSTNDLVGHSGQTKKVISGSKTQSSVILPPEAKGGDEISFEDPEEASPVVSQPFKRRRNVKTNPSVFEAVFEEYKTSPQTPEENVSNRLEKSSGMKNASASPQRSLHDRSGNRHVQELEQQSDVQSDTTSPNRRQPQSTHDLVGHSGQTKNVISSSKTQSSVILPPEAKGGDEISFEGPEEAGPVVSQPFKRRRNVKTNPSVFEAVFEEYNTSSQTTEENVSNRLEKSSGMKNASASPQRSLRDRSGNRHVQELEEQSDVQSDSTSPNRRQPHSTHDLVGHSGQTKNVISGSTSQSSVILPPESKGGDEISFEDPKEACPVVSQPFRKRRNVVFEEYVTSPRTSEENVSNRHEKSSNLNTASSSLQTSQNDRLGTERFHGFNLQSDISSISVSSDRRQIESPNIFPIVSGQKKRVTFTSSTPQSSVAVLQQLKGRNKIHVEVIGEVSSVVSHSVKERGNIRTNPSSFQAALQDFVTSSPKYEEDVSNRHKESDQLNASSSPQTAQSDRSGNEHVRELEQQSNVPSNSGSPNRRQAQSTDVLPSLSGQTKNAAFTSPTPQNSTILQPHLKGVGEISVETREKASPIVSQPFEKSRHKDSRQTKDASALANASQGDKETGRVHTLVEQSYVPSNSSSSNKRWSEKESTYVRPGVSNGTEQNKVQSTSNKSVRPQNVAWYRRWQEKATATGNARAFNLLSKEERIAKLEEFVRDVKEKHEVAFKSKCKTKISELEELENVKIIHPIAKRKVCKKPLRLDLLVDGKPYRPRLKRPKPWATSRLYKLIIAKCEVKYGTLKAQRKAEEFVVHLCEKVSTVLRRKKYENYEGNLEEIKKALYKLGVIKCLMDYFVFIEDYLPFEYRIKAIPCLRAYGKNTGPPMAPDTDLFADLHY